MATHGGHEHVAADETLFGQEFWDQRYGGSPALWSGRPNPQLVAEAAGLEPGRALDAGCGEGADAIWLVERDWQVTAVDISTVALDRGTAQAARLGDPIASRISWQHADLRTWAPAPRSYDFVNAQYMQLPPHLRTGLFDRLAAGVASGGTLLIVGHSPSDLATAARRPPLPELFFTADEIADALDASLFKILVRQARPRQVRDPDDQLITIHDEVLTARRR